MLVVVGMMSMLLTVLCALVGFIFASYRNLNYFEQCIAYSFWLMPAMIVVSCILQMKDQYRRSERLAELKRQREAEKNDQQQSA